MFNSLTPPPKKKKKLKEGLSKEPEENRIPAKKEPTVQETEPETFLNEQEQDQALNTTDRLDEEGKEGFMD